MSISASRARRPGRRGPWLVVIATVVAAVALGACGDDSGSAPTITGAAAKRGQALAGDQGCTNCHTDNGRRSTGPSWADLAGSEVTLDGGETVTADADYLGQAIVDPGSQVVAGFSNIMPATYGDDLSSDEVDDLVAYLQELSPDTGG